MKIQYRAPSKQTNKWTLKDNINLMGCDEKKFYEKACNYK